MLCFSTKLLNAHSDAELIFPVGKVQAVLMMNHQGLTGLVLANGSRWSGSEKAEPIKYYIGDENIVMVHVHLFGDAAIVEVSVNDDHWSWVGRMSELALDRQSSPWKNVQGGDKFGIATTAGGVEVQSMKLNWR